MTSETILITRPREDGIELSDALHERGFRVIHEPLMDVFLQHTARMDLERAIATDPHAIILTSRHGVRALASLCDLRDLPLLCVGDATAEVAASLGYDRISIAGGNVDRLLQFAVGAYDEGSRFLYPSGAHISSDIAAELAVSGMEVERVVVYEATAVERLSDVLTEQLKRGQIDAVTFLSTRTARIFMELLEKAELTHAAHMMRACCMSESIAATLNPRQWKGIAAASEATLASVAECVDNVFPMSKSHV